MTQPEQVDSTAQPEPLPLDERWPGWAVDLLVAEQAAAALGAALLGAVPVVALVAAFGAWATRRQAAGGGSSFDFTIPDGTSTTGSGDRAREIHTTEERRVTLSVVTEWLSDQVPLDYLVAEITPPLSDAAAEGALVGHKSAQAVVDALVDGHDPRSAERDDDAGVTLEVDWEGWTPGHPEAARQILSADGVDIPWLDLLERDGITVSSIARGRLDEIAAVLADGLEEGHTPAEIAEALRGVLDDPDWAMMTALTETNRATSAATLVEYEASEIPAKGWMTAFDQRVCPRCKRNEEQGSIALGERFESGELHPPAHPRCRCALIPELALKITKALDGGRSLRHYWTHGEGLPKWIGDPHPWTALYRHLRKHMSDRLAKRTASRWFHDTTGMWPGERKGKNPVGRG